MLGFMTNMCPAGRGFAGQGPGARWFTFLSADGPCPPLPLPLPRLSLSCWLPSRSLLWRPGRRRAGRQAGQEDIGQAGRGGREGCDQFMLTGPAGQVCCDWPCPSGVLLFAWPCWSGVPRQGVLCVVVGNDIRVVVGHGMRTASDYPPPLLLAAESPPPFPPPLQFPSLQFPPLTDMSVALVTSYITVW